MLRSLALAAATVLLLAGVWALRPGAPGRAGGDSRLTAGDRVPRRAPAPPRLAVPDAMSDSTPITLLVETRAAGTTRYALARVSLDGAEALVCAPDGRIPAFATPDAALAWATRVLPRPRDPRDAAAWDAMSAGMRGGTPLRFDLDAAYAWSRRASRDGLSPDAMLGAWTVLAMSAELPMPPRGDPVAMSFARGEAGDRALTADEELALSLMKVDLVVALAQREHGDVHAATWPAEPEVWTDADARRVARELERAIPAFVARLTDDVDGVEQALARGR